MHYHHGDLRAALLETAARMIAEEGIEQLTMREIGARLGVSRTAPYRHFSDKESLLVAVAAEGFGRLVAELRRAGDQPADDLESFRMLGIAYIHFALANPAHYRLMYGSQALRRDDHPELATLADSAYNELVEIIRRLQQARKVVRGDPAALAYVAWSAVHGLASLLIDRQIAHPENADALARLTTKVLMEGLAV